MDQRDRPKFAVDSMLGTLAKWLRIMGYDTIYFQRGEDVALERIALRGRRVLLTRDRGIVKRGNCRSILVRSDQLSQQLTQVIRELGLKLRGEAFTRCVICNFPLTPMEKEEAKAKVPSYIYQTQERFITCRGCGRIYWSGTHWKKMAERLKEIVGAYG